MKILLDTNTYKAFCMNDPSVVHYFQTAERIYISFVTLAELRAGFQCGTIARKNENGLIRFVNRPRVSQLYPDETTTHHYARLFFQLRKQGTPIPTNDIWIAALAVQYDLLLLSGDHHFENLPQLPRL